MLARVVLSRGTLVFGGHPAISPLVLAVARQLCAVDRVEIFQSEFFRATVPPDSIAFPRLVWTRELAGDRDASLQEMRERMMREYVFGAGFFIGGMDGVEDEHAMFRALQPDVPTFPVGSTGGAALALLNKGEGPGDPTQQYMLRNDLVYAYLIERLLGLAP